MIHTIAKNVAVPGTREALSAVKINAGALIVQGKHNNAGPIFLGDVTVAKGSTDLSAGGNDHVGHVLLAGDSMALPYIGGYVYALTEIFIDAEDAGDGVEVSYVR